MNCMDCGFNNREDIKFCTKCSTPLFQLCLKCGFPGCEGDLFCGGCGYRLQAPYGKTAPLPSQPAKAHGAVSKQAAQPPSGTAPSMESERRNVTVLFADISGFTAMSELLDPEEVTEIMNGCLKLLADSVIKHEGYVDKFIGDCIMAIFGAPVSHENDPELAVLAALEMRKRIEEYNKNLTVKLEKPLTLHIGINTGTVIAGGVGSDQKMEYTVMGDTVNLASRLESNAGTGQIFASGYTYNLTRNQFDFIKHDPIKVKGKKKPVDVYEVQKTRSQQAQSRKETAASPLVGRSHEMETLNTCLKNLVSSSMGHAVFLIAEAGVGKSRINQEVKNQLQKGDYQIIESICQAFNSATGYFTFSELFKQMFGIDSDDMEESMAEKVSQNIPLLLGLDSGALVTEAREAIVFIGAILGLKLGEEYDIQVDQMDAQEIQIAAFRSIAWFFERLALKKPVVMVIENLQYADSTSVALIAHLIEKLKRIPLMLLLLMRPQKEHPSSKLPMIAKKALENQCTEINFNRLVPAECDEMIRSLLDVKTLPEELLKMVRTRSDGNPLYIEEIVRSLVEEEIVEKTDDGEIRVAKNFEEVSIPNSLHGMITARIDKLQSRLKDILNFASVIGPVFQFQLIQAVADQGDLEERINQLVDMGLIFESKSFPEIEYSFRNIMTREAVYSCLLLQKRKELHAKVAKEVERLYENRLEDHYEVLARHFQQAGDLDKACHYLFQSGLRAKDAYANKDAEDYFQQAIQLAEGQDAPSVSLVEVYTFLSEVQELLGELDAAIDSRRKAMDFTEDTLKKADTVRNIGRIHEKRGVKNEAMKAYDESADLLKDHPKSLEMGLLTMNRSWVLNRMHKYEEAMEKGLEALKILEPLEDQENIAQVYNNLSVICEHKGELDKAQDYNLKSLKLFSESGNKRKTANIYLSLGYLENKRKNLEAAIDHFNKSHEIMERIGNLFGAGTALMSKGRCYMDLERLDESESALLQSLRIHKDMGLKRKTAANELAIGKVYLAKGENKPARDHLEAARQVAQEEGYSSDLARITHQEARLLIKEGKSPDKKFQEAIDLFKGLGREREADSISKELESFSKAEETG